MKSLIAALVILTVAICTTTSVNAQTWRPDWATKVVLAGGGTDITNTVTITALAGGVAPTSYTWPNATPGTTGFMLTSATNGALTWTNPAVGVVLAGDVIGQAGANTINGTAAAGNHIVTAVNLATNNTLNADVLKYDGTLQVGGVAANQLGLNLSHANSWLADQTFLTDVGQSNAFVASINGAGTSAINIAHGGTNSNTALVGSSIMVATGGQIVQGQTGTTTTVLHGNAAGVPTYGSVVNADIANGTIDLTAKVTGLLPIANGGTNASAVPTAGAVAYGTGAAYAFTGVGVAGQVLTSAAGGTPTWTNSGSQVIYGETTPAALAAGNTNNYGLLAANTTVYYISGTAPGSTLTGIAAGADGRMIILVNISANSITLSNADLGSGAANQFHLQGGSNIILGQDGTATLVYDGSAGHNYWRVTTNY